MNSKKLAIIGAGASGLACAVEAKRTAEKLGENIDITVFERMQKPAKKLLVTGNGRCNFTNEDLSENHFHGDKALIDSLLNCKYEDSVSFFDSLGVKAYRENGRIYPKSEQAAAIRDALLNMCGVLKIKILTDSPVTAVKKEGKLFCVNSELFDSVIAAGGGKAAPVQGSDGSVFEILKAFGHTLTPLYPALTGLISSDRAFKELKGLRAKCKITLYNKETALGEEYGEIQFNDSGISGIPVMNLSYLCKDKADLSAVLDTCCDMTNDDLVTFLTERKNQTPILETEDVLSGLISRKLGYTVMAHAGIKPHTLSGNLSDTDIKKLSAELKSLTFSITGVKDFKDAQVTCGGIAAEEIDASTLMSKKCGGLFIAGELLNINGDCGGYNLQIAWTSGRLSGSSAVKYIFNKDSKE